MQKVSLILSSGKVIDLPGVTDVRILMLSAPTASRATSVSIDLPETLGLTLQLASSTALYQLVARLWQAMYVQCAADVDEAMEVIQKIVSGEYQITELGGTEHTPPGSG